LKRFNELLALNITKAVCTMWAFYVFVLYGLTPIIVPQYTDKILYWSNFFQLIFLPAITIGQAVLGKSAEKQAQETHDAVMVELDEIKEILSILHSQNKEES
jgi:hypothetical protein